MNKGSEKRGVWSLFLFTVILELLYLELLYLKLNYFYKLSMKSAFHMKKMKKFY